MLKVEFRGLSNVTKALDQALRSEIQLLANTVYSTVKGKTPVDTGRARGGWTKNVKDKTFVVQNDVPYITVLDKGRHMTNRGMRGSKQAPRGIIGPSLNSIKGKN